MIQRKNQFLLSPDATAEKQRFFGGAGGEFKKAADIGVVLLRGLQSFEANSIALPFLTSHQFNFHKSDWRHLGWGKSVLALLLPGDWKGV